MKKLILLTLLLITAVLTANAQAGNFGNWLLYLPAILGGSDGSSPPVVDEKSPWLLFLPAILSGVNQTPDDTVTLNDTGITWDANYTTGNNTTCSSGVESSQQDCAIGLDVTQDNDLNGIAGFNFTKIAANGVLLDASASDWSCVKDNTTGLTWEVKTDNDSQIHYSMDTFSWYNTDAATNGGDVGTETSFVSLNCEGYTEGQADTYCNTTAFVDRVNTVGLCGETSGWRVPTVKELLSIVSYFNSGTVGIDLNYFPNTAAGTHLSWTPSAQFSTDVWTVHFPNGEVINISDKSSTLRVRLVRTAE